VGFGQLLQVRPQKTEALHCLLKCGATIVTGHLTTNGAKAKKLTGAFHEFLL
jgi:hypothetical protein